MDRFNRMIEKQVNQPHSYNELRQSPFPYLEECNRMQIFQFIHQLEAQNKQLSAKVQQKYPDKSMEEIFERHKILRLKRDMVDIHQKSIEHMQIELKTKRMDLERLREGNIILEKQSGEQQRRMKEVEQKLIEVEKEKRDQEFQLKLYRERQSEVDTSGLFQNLYKDVRDILQSSI